MTDPQVISLSDPKTLKPNLSVSSSGDTGTIKLNNLPALDTPKKSVNFGPFWISELHSSRIMFVT